MKRDAVNGNVETTGIMVNLSSRDLDILKDLGVCQGLSYLWWCLPYSTPSFFLNQILVLFPWVQSWRWTSVSMPATRLHPHIYASGNTFYISTHSYRGDFHSNGRNIKKAPD